LRFPICSLRLICELRLLIALPQFRLTIWS
jgi:hypothetical protein